MILNYNRTFPCPGSASDTLAMVAVRNREKATEQMRALLGLGPEVKHRQLFTMMENIKMDETMEVDVPSTRDLLNNNLGCLVNVPVGVIEYTDPIRVRGMPRLRLELVYDDIFIADAQLIKSMKIIIDAQMNY